MAQQECPHYADTNMTDSQQRALSECLDMVAEYEDSPQWLEDELTLALIDRPAKPPGLSNTSPLARPALTRSMSMEVDKLALPPPAFNTRAGSPFAASPPATTNTRPPPKARPTSPVTVQAPTKTRPKPNPSNPWYTSNLDVASTQDKLLSILKQVHSTCEKWTFEFPPAHFRDFARKAHRNWNNANPELRQICIGLREVHEFLVCGPEDWVLSCAFKSEVFEQLLEVVADTLPHLRTLVGVEGCGWLNEGLRSPLLGIEVALEGLKKEREEYKKGLGESLPEVEKLSRKMGEVTMGDSWVS